MQGKCIKIEKEDDEEDFWETACFTHKETLERWGAAYLGAKLPGIPISGHILGGFVSRAAYFYFENYSKLL